VSARRERVAIAGGALAALLAVALIVLAVDVLRWQSRLASGDVAFEAAPRTPGDRWAGGAVLPFWFAEPALGIDDDLAYRDGIQLFARVEPGEVQIYGPRLENILGEAQVAIGRLSRDDPELGRRSRALNLMGVFQISRTVTDSAERIAVLRQGIGLFQGAVRLDESNADAKYNLELLLRDAGAAVLSGDVPSGQAAEGERSGAGRAGTGY
jgi:hypothetical protein